MTNRRLTYGALGRGWGPVDMYHFITSRSSDVGMMHSVWQNGYATYRSTVSSDMYIWFALCCTSLSCCTGRICLQSTWLHSLLWAIYAIVSVPVMWWWQTWQVNCTKYNMMINIYAYQCKLLIKFEFESKIVTHIFCYVGIACYTLTMNPFILWHNIIDFHFLFQGQIHCNRPRKLNWYRY